MIIDDCMPRAISLQDLLDFLPSIAACTVLLIVFGPLSVLMFPMILVASFALLLYKKRIKAGELRKHELRESAKAMRAIHGSISKGMNIAGSIEKAARSVEGSGISSVLVSLKQRILLGQDLARAADAEASKNASWRASAGAFEPLQREYAAIGSVGASASNSAIALEKRYAEIRTNEDGRLPRYLIIGMVSSTVLPSMATFAFVGYSILYYSAIFLLLYCAIMLGVLPNVYSAVRMKLSGLYNG